MGQIACFALFFTLGWGVAGCGDDSLLKELRDTRDKVCQCQDRACALALRASSASLEARLQELSAADQERAQRIAIEMMACLQKL